jgi:hypothetical protein
MIKRPQADTAPFVFTFDDPSGERIGIVAYAFLATRTPTKNRPRDERSFQIKYGSKERYAAGNSHDLWQDPLGMFTTLLVGIDPDEEFCVSADPIVHSPTKFFIRVEFKDEHAESTRKKGWYAWQRIKRTTPADALRVETLVGATKDNLLELIRFERAAQGMDPGNRLILAEKRLPSSKKLSALAEPLANLTYIAENHPLVAQFKLSPNEILNLIDGTRRLKMAVRGWVAEEHLRSVIEKVPGVTLCQRLDAEGGPDLEVAYKKGPRLTIECKNVARERDRYGNPRIDFQRTRASKGNPCSRYYERDEFDVVAACLHAVTDRWNFMYTLPARLPEHQKCSGRISSNIRVDGQWVEAVEDMFKLAYGAKGLRP